MPDLACGHFLIRRDLQTPLPAHGPVDLPGYCSAMRS